MTYLSDSDEGQAIMPKNSARPKLQFLVIKVNAFLSPRRVTSSQAFAEFSFAITRLAH